MLLTTLVNLGLQFYFVITPHVQDKDKVRFISLICETVICVYITLAAACNCLTSQVTSHKSLTSHTCALSSVLFVHWYLATIGQYLSLQYSGHSHWTQYCALGLSLLQTVISGTIPMGPLLWVDRSKLYSKSLTKTIRSVDIKEEPNVDLGASASIFGYLLFTFVIPMISKTSAMDQIDIQDLPAGTASFRMQNNLHASFKANHTNVLTKRLGPTMRLLWTVWSPQWRLLLKSEQSYKDCLTRSSCIHTCTMPHVVQILHGLDHHLDRGSAIAFGALLSLSRLGAHVLVLQQLCT